jgi:two-component system, NarL family, sensor kinase
MKKILSILLLSFYALTASAQNIEKINDLKQKLGVVKTDTGKVMLLYSLFVQHREFDSTVAMNYANEGLALSKKINFPKGQSLLLLNKGVFLNLNGENDEAKKLINVSLKIRISTKDYAGVGYCLRSLGNLEYDKNEYANALKYYLDAAPEFEKANDMRGLAGDYIWVGNVFNEGLHQYDKAVEYFNKSLTISKQLNDSSLLSYNYNNLGSAFYFSKKYKDALYWFGQSKAIKEKLKDERGIGSTSSNISNVFTDTKKYDSAAFYNNIAMLIRTKQNDKKGLATSYSNAANIFLFQKKSDSAFTYYQKAIALGKEIDFKEPVIESYNGLSQYYQLKGDADKALDYYKKYKAANDSVYNTDISNQLNTLQTKYETSKKEKLIDDQKFEILKKQYWIYGSAAIIFLMALLGFSYYKRNRIQQKIFLQHAVMKEQELATAAVIEAEENERKRIARDLHDGVGQMLSAAKMNLSLIGENKTMNTDEKNAFDKAIALVDESCREVRTVSHNMMPNALIKFGLASAVRAFIEQIESPVLKVQLYTEGLTDSLNKNTETVLYRVLQECVNNVIKHAHASNLDIALIKDESGINATIEDNGIGFDTADKNKFSGIGIDNMLKRINFLKGSIEWQSSEKNGTLVAIFIPS